MSWNECYFSTKLFVSSKFSVILTQSEAETNAAEIMVYRVMHIFLEELLKYMFNFRSLRMTILNQSMYNLRKHV